MKWLLGLVGGDWIKLGLYIAIALAVAAVGARLVWLDNALKTARLETQEQIAGRATDRAQWAQQSAAAAEKNRQLTEQYQHDKDEAEAKHAQRVQNLQRLLSAASTNGVRLRAEIAAYASDSGRPADPTCTAERQRAQTLGVLLGKADERAERDAGELETMNSEKSYLLEACPHRKE